MDQSSRETAGSGRRARGSLLDTCMRYQRTDGERHHTIVPFPPAVVESFLLLLAGFGLDRIIECGCMVRMQYRCEPFC